MAEQHVRWDEFDKIHVIRKLREIVGRWWKIQLNFTDQKGLLRGVPEGKFFNPLNHVCKAITENGKGFDGCRGTARTTTAALTNSKGVKISACRMRKTCARCVQMGDPVAPHRAGNAP